MAEDSNKPIVLAVTGDWHVNDTTALCPPGYHIDHGAIVGQSKLQRAIWRAWLKYWELVEAKREQVGGRVYSVCLGDLGDLNKHDGVQLVSRHRGDVIGAMADVAAPMARASDKIFILRGTEAHVGACGELEELFAQDLDNTEHDAERGTASWWTLRATFGGVDCFFAHHPPTGTRIASKRGQAAARMAERLAEQFMIARKWPPQVAFFAHNHWAAQGEEFGIRVHCCPSWKGIGGYGYRIGVVRPSAVGGWICVAHEGQFTAELEVWNPPEGGRWTES